MPGVICSNCGAQNADQARFCQTCGVSLAGVHTAEQQSPGTAAEYAGFWARFVAILLDAIIVAFGSAILFGAAHVSGGLASLFLPWIYEAAMLSSKKQATVGKIVLGILVTDVDHRPITFARASGRHFAKYLSGLILGIGFLMAAFTEKKQALHDMIAGTIVVMGKK